MYESFPAQLHYSTEDSSIEITNRALLYERAYIMLQYLQNSFLLHRLALARGLTDSQGLVEVALKMLDISLMFWMKRDQLMVFSSGFDWIVRIPQSSHNPLLINPDHLLWYSIGWGRLY